MFQCITIYARVSYSVYIKTSVGDSQTIANNNNKRMHNKQRIRVIVPLINCLLCVCGFNRLYTGLCWCDKST